jgi:CheY-like chemotaxis protein
MTVAGVDTTDAERIRVLFVEDEFFIREWIARSLSEQGFAVDSVTNAVDALLRIARAPIDVLLTDINLPGGMDGTVLARRA